MAKRKRPRKPPSQSGGQGGRGEPDRRRPLPRPDACFVESGQDPTQYGVAGIKGIIVNPVYTGIGKYPRMISDDQWVEAAGKLIDQDGPDQFLVNLLYILRRTLGCIEWDGQLPPDTN